MATVIDSLKNISKLLKGNIRRFNRFDIYGQERADLEWADIRIENVIASISKKRKSKKEE